MKRFIGMALALFLSVGVTDASAQSFLKKLGKTVNDVSREVNKHVNKGTKNTSGTSKQQQKKPQTQEAASSNQSFEEQNERHLRILEEKGEIIRPVVVENPPKDQAPVTGKTNGHEWIDLGLPSGIKWAACNVGAKSSEELGHTFKWACIAPEIPDVSHRADSYGKWMSGIGGSAQYDAAASMWGGAWRMPTKVDIQELMDNCTWEYTTLGRVTGCKAISKINGNYIFFPIQFYQDLARYWSSTPSAYQGNYESQSLTIYKESISINSKMRGDYYPIRPVIK